MANQPTTTGSPPSTAHLPYLDGLRALAALYVVLHHAVTYVDAGRDPSVALAPVVTVAREISRYGLYAVDVFIMLSGFCLMIPVVRGDGTIPGGLGRFLARRARRILPAYYLAMIACLALVATLIGAPTGTIWDTSVPVRPRNIAFNTLLIHDVVYQAYKINYVFWSVAVEWRIYFLFPLLLIAWKRVGAIPTALATVVGSALLYMLGRRFLGVTFSIHYLGQFALGMLGASIAFSPDPKLDRLRRLPWGRIALAATLAVVVYSEVWAWSGLHIPFEGGEFLAGLWGMSLLVAASPGRSARLGGWLGARPLTGLGAFAYSLYLVHAPVLQVVWQYLIRPWEPGPTATLAAMVLGALPLAVGLAYLFYLACERPFLRKPSRHEASAVSARPRRANSRPAQVVY